MTIFRSIAIMGWNGKGNAFFCACGFLSLIKTTVCIKSSIVSIVVLVRSCIEVKKPKEGAEEKSISADIPIHCNCWEKHARTVNNIVYDICAGIKNGNINVL